MLFDERDDIDKRWPTPEMSSRATITNLIWGLFIAFASGIGVALSVVGDFSSAIIGVAISASLLPPAVNWGMLWALAVLLLCEPEWQEFFEYSPKELIAMGAISIFLTIE